MYDQRLSYNEIESYLESKENISTVNSRFGNRKDLYFDIHGQKLGRISISESNGRYTLWSPIHGSSSKIKEDVQVLTQIASKYGVKIILGGNGTIYATKGIESSEDIDNFYDFSISNKSVRYKAEGDQTRLSFGLEQLLASA